MKPSFCLVLIVVALVNVLHASAFASLPRNVPLSSRNVESNPSWRRGVEASASRIPAKVSLKQGETDDITASPSLIVKLASSPLGALVVLLGVVLFHESGHYLASRSFGVHPEEFSIGFGPKLAGMEMFGDDFNLRVVPFGGYVRFSPETLLPLPWQERIVISSAGVLMNLLLATMIYTVEILFGQGIVQPVLEAGVLITGIQERASASGKLRPGDVIMRVNNKATPKSLNPSQAESQQSITNIIDAIQATPEGGSVELFIERKGVSMDVSVTPQRVSPDESPTIGVFLEPNVVGVELLKSDSLLQAASLASRYTASITKETALGILSFLGDLFSFRKSQYQVRGPVAVLQRASEVVSTRNVDSILNYMAGISINFAVVNLVPIPPTDGFQILLILAQALPKNL